ncbi:MAG TPA: TIM-barrel domain-containing protein [Prolixibacteraceae bacterium]|nr:TIM-barrel domain-containing protein [Prolixibacteraceae bacterium]
MPIVNTKSTTYILILAIFAVFQNFQLSAQELPVTWQQKASGVWIARVGKPDSINFSTVSGVKPKLNALNAMADVSFPIQEGDIKVVKNDGKLYLQFPLEVGEKVFGLGLNFKTVEQRGRILRLHVDHYGGQDNGRTHAPVPFYVSSKGYGVFINSARYLDVWVGTAVRKDSKIPMNSKDRNTDKSWSSKPYSDNVSVLVPADGVEIIVFGGPSTLDAVSRFNLYNGGGCIPPKWGLGFWQRTPTLYTDSMVLSDVKEFREHQFPLSVIGLEPGWQSKSYPCTYEWDRGRFPDPAKFVGKMNELGVKTNLWINPYISPDAKIISKLLPYTASHTVWSGYVPDYGLPETNRIIGNQMKTDLLSIGVSGFKMDENDGYDNWLWPDVTLFPSKIPAEEMRQLYGLMMQKMTTKLYREQNKRTYGLVRASNAGGVSFPYVIYNDYYSHRDFITALINSSFIGVLWTPEVRGSKTAEEWLRRMQTVCFSPLAMINAWSDGTKPWSFPEVEKQVTDVANLRMQLIPYLYTCFAEYAFYGRPPIRAMNLVDGFTSIDKKVEGKLSSTENPYAEATKKEMKDQFMVGDNLLVAPLFAEETKREVILPQGKWYDFYTGELAGEGQVIEVSPGLDHIPVFVRDGGIIPMATPSQIKGKDNLIMRYYGQKPATYKLYDDDGETFNYEKGEYSWRTVQVILNKKGVLVGSISQEEKNKPNSYGNISFEFMTK